MKKIIPILFLYILFCFIQQALIAKSNNKFASNKKISAEFNKNVEFLGFIFHLAFIGPDEMATLNYAPTKHYRAYGLKIYQEYKSFLQSPHLQKIGEIGYTLDYNPAIKLMFQVDDFPHAKINDRISESDYIHFAPNKDIEAGKKNIEILLEEMNQFYLEVNFNQYLAEAKPYYEKAHKELLNIKPNDTFIPAMEDYYQKEFNSYHLIPSLLIPSGMGFALHFNPIGKQDIFNVFGPLNDQNLLENNLNMGFQDINRMLELSIHEFGHSFSNPVLDEISDSLINASEQLFQPIASDMSDQAYHTWDTSLKEHFVRAGEVILSREIGNREAAEKLKNHYINDRKFIYLPQILSVLEEYRKGKISTYHEAVVISLTRLCQKIK